MKITPKHIPTYVIELSDSELNDLIAMVERGIVTNRYHGPAEDRALVLLRTLIARGGPTHWIDTATGQSGTIKQP